MDPSFFFLDPPRRRFFLDGPNRPTAFSYFLPRRLELSQQPRRRFSVEGSDVGLIKTRFKKMPYRPLPIFSFLPPSILSPLKNEEEGDLIRSVKRAKSGGPPMEFRCPEQKLLIGGVGGKERMVDKDISDPLPRAAFPLLVLPLIP